MSLKTKTKNISIVLHKPKYAGNIGAVARAAKNMGVRNIIVAGSNDFDREEMQQRSTHLAADVLDDIQYVESRKEYVVIFSENSIPVMTLFSLKSIEDRLPKNTFMRVHRSFIVNLTKIVEVVQNKIMFDKDTGVPIGDQYKKDFQEFLSEHFLK